MRNRILLALLLLPLLGAKCRKDPPPAIEICQGDGHGGADCNQIDGTVTYRKPSQLENYWMSNQADMDKFVRWCYEVPQSKQKAVDLKTLSQVPLEDEEE